MRIPASQFDLKFDRISITLRRGGSVMIRDAKGQAALIRAAEFSDIAPERLEDIGTGSEILCLTRRHMTAFGRTVPDKLNCFTLPSDTFDDGQITALILGDGTLLPAEANILGERKNSLPDMACQLLRAVRLIPSALLSRVSEKNHQRHARLAESFQIPVLDLHELTNLTEDTEPEMSISITATLPLAIAPDAKIVMFRQPANREEHFAILVGNSNAQTPPLVRLHSQCITGDILGSLKCDCGPQLQAALMQMQEVGGGILLYLAQEGRDIGLLNKIRAYALQDAGLDTVDANHRLGFETDERVFSPAAAMLKALGVSTIRLMTNNPDKLNQLGKYGIIIDERVALNPPANPHNHNYLETKKTRTGHFIDPN
jgi:GTP cyclohydrolase II